MKIYNYLLAVIGWGCLLACAPKTSPSEASLYPYDPAIHVADSDRMQRLKLDFCRTEEEVKTHLLRYYPDLTDSMMQQWEATQALEWMQIDGKKRYFRNAAPNLFRIDSASRICKESKEGVYTEPHHKLNQTLLPAIINEAKQFGVPAICPTRFRITYTLTVNADAVPSGDTIRCWLPYPREDNRRQTNVLLDQVYGSSDYIISPIESPHRTLYLEKIAEAGKATQFSYTCLFNTTAEWFNLTDEQIKPYQKQTPLYRLFTAQRDTHIRFTDSIKSLSERIVGDEKRPLQIVRKLFAYISDQYPWASAREYATVPNIPQYVIDNKHGDCGMVSLLFITLARYNGIPAKWQSGFMLYPEGVNLHDWAEVYFEGVGWVPVDQSFGIPPFAQDDELRYFYTNGIDSYRWIVNDDYSGPLFPAKRFARSETVDFQRGEVEWRGGNLYFNQWNYDIDVRYLDEY